MGNGSRVSNRENTYANVYRTNEEDRLSFLTRSDNETKHQNTKK